MRSSNFSPGELQDGVRVGRIVKSRRKPRDKTKDDVAVRRDNVACPWELLATRNLAACCGHTLQSCPPPSSMSLASLQPKHTNSSVQEGAPWFSATTAPVSRTDCCPLSLATDTTSCSLPCFEQAGGQSAQAPSSVCFSSPLCSYPIGGQTAKGIPSSACLPQQISDASDSRALTSCAAATVCPGIVMPCGHGIAVLPSVGDCPFQLDYHAQFPTPQTISCDFPVGTDCCPDSQTGWMWTHLQKDSSSIICCPSADQTTQSSFSGQPGCVYDAWAANLLANGFSSQSESPPQACTILDYCFPPHASMLCGTDTACYDICNTEVCVDPDCNGTINSSPCCSGRATPTQKSPHGDCVDPRKLNQKLIDMSSSGSTTSCDITENKQSSLSPLYTAFLPCNCSPQDRPGPAQTSNLGTSALAFDPTPDPTSNIAPNWRDQHWRFNMQETASGNPQVGVSAPAEDFHASSSSLKVNLPASIFKESVSGPDSDCHFVSCEPRPKNSPSTQPCTEDSSLPVDRQTLTGGAALQVSSSLPLPSELGKLEALVQPSVPTELGPVNRSTPEASATTGAADSGLGASWDYSGISGFSGDGLFDVGISLHQPATGSSTKSSHQRQSQSTASQFRPGSVVTSSSPPPTPPTPATPLNLPPASEGPDKGNFRSKVMDEDLITEEGVLTGIRNMIISAPSSELQGPVPSAAPTEYVCKCYVLSEDGSSTVPCGLYFSGPQDLNKHASDNHVVPIRLPEAVEGKKATERTYCFCPWPDCKRNTRDPFPARVKVARHLMVHTNYRPFICTFCGRGHTTKEQLENHIRTHTKERPFECELCGHCSATATQHRNHIRTHTRERPFQCPLCPYRCSDSSNMSKHKRNKHGLKSSREGATGGFAGEDATQKQQSTPDRGELVEAGPSGL